MRKNIIEKEDALEAWNDPKTKVLFEITFGSFDNYWAECERFNNASPEEQEKMRKSALDKLNKTKTNQL